MNSLREMIGSTASNIRRVVQEKAQIQIDEARLKLETHVRVAKKFVEPTVPPVDVAALNKIASSLDVSLNEMTSSVIATGRGKVKSILKRTDAHGEIVKPEDRAQKKKDEQCRKRLTLWLARQKKREKYERSKVEPTRRKWLAMTKLEDEFREFSKKQNELRARRALLEKQKSIERNQSLPPKPSPKPAQDVPVREETHEERRKFINDRLTAILGPKRMRMPALPPSGNNPLDPAIVEYNKHKFEQTVLNELELYKAEVRRKYQEAQAEAQAEQQRKEAERQEIKAKVDRLRVRYVVRLEKLVSFGPALAKAMDILEETGTQPFKEWEATRTVDELTWQVLRPIQELLSECAADKFPLEQDGAEVLKNAWPIQRMVQLVELLHHQYQHEFSLSEETMAMARRLYDILKSVENPTPFVNALAPKPEPPFGFDHDKFLANVKKYHEKAKRSSTSIMNATAGSDPAKPAVGNAGKMNNSQKAAPGTQQADSPKRTAVLGHVTTNGDKLMEHAFELINRSDNKVSDSNRRSIEALFKQILNDAGGCEGLLEETEGRTYRSQVYSCKGSLDSLSPAQRKILAHKNLYDKCDKVLKLWK